MSQKRADLVAQGAKLGMAQLVCIWRFCLVVVQTSFSESKHRILIGRNALESCRTPHSVFHASPAEGPFLACNMRLTFFKCTGHLVRVPSASPHATVVVIVRSRRFLRSLARAVLVCVFRCAVLGSARRAVRLALRGGRGPWNARFCVFLCCGASPAAQKP